MYVWKSDKNLIYDYIGQYPKDREMGWSQEVNGVCHDKDNWFFTQDGNLWKFPVTHNLNSKCENPDASKGILKVSVGHHLGDIDYYKGHVFVPDSDNLSIRIYRASDLAFVSEQFIKRGDGKKFTSIGWLAINPNNGLLYTSDKHTNKYTPGDTCCINIYEIGDVTKPNALTFYSTLTLCDLKGKALPREHMQGGCFDDNNFLHIVNGYVTKVGESWANSKGGISVFRVNPYPSKGSNEETNRIEFSNQEKGFRFQFDGKGDEPEGITYWDLDSDNRAPGISGQLHAIMINNLEGGTIVNWITNSSVATDIDDFFFKHYRRKWNETKGKISLSSVAVNEPVTITITGDLKVAYYEVYLKYNWRHNLIFQWQRGQYQGDPSGEWENIWGAISDTYTPTPDDHGYHIRVKAMVETEYKPLYSSACYVNAPHITGTAEIPSEVRCGQEITVKLTGDLGKVPTDRISFVWERKGDDDDYWHRYIATGNKYTPTKEDVGKKIRVYVDPYDYTTFLDSNEASVLPALKRRNPRLGGSTRPVRKTSRSKV